MLVLATMFFWWRDIIREAEYQGHHTPIVQIGMRYGMMLFISSEVMFFVAFFWAFFDRALFPVGGIWPPEGIETFNPFDLPLINTLILLLSGCSVTWAHHALVQDNRRDFIIGLAITIALGAFFTVLQGVEYSHAPFSFIRRDLSFGLLHGNRLPRLSCDCRDIVPCCLPVAWPEGAFHRQAAFRL